jgi:hypothetical protein
MENELDSLPWRHMIYYEASGKARSHGIRLHSWKLLDRNEGKRVEFDEQVHFLFQRTVCLVVCSGCCGGTFIPFLKAR